MSAEQSILLVVGLIVIAAVAMTVAYATAHARRRESQTGRAGERWPGWRDHDDVGASRPDADTMTSTAWPEATGRVGRAGSDASRGAPGTPATPGQPRTSSTLISPTSVRQVARVVALLYLAAVAVVVALTRAWPETEPAIFTLLALGTLLVVLVMDLVPPAALGRWRRPAEAVGAVVFLGLLASLTGGATSPFFVGFFLVVAGTALSTEGRAPLAIAFLAAATLALVGLVDALGSPLDPTAVAWVGFNAVALILLADIATAAARAQRHARDEALRASRFDALTGLYNRGFFFTTMEQEIRRSERMDRGFAMLMLDLDDLKPVNDRFGHQWGDRLLRAVAETIRRTIRFTDSAARYGGDEFVVLLPETDAAGGYVVGEKLRRDIAAVTLHAADRVVRSSVSVGLVTYPDDGTTIEQLVAAADVAMYESKRRGKNRVVGYQARAERVATAIDVDAGAASAAITPFRDVRTGGDPAPWGQSTGPVASVEPPLPRPTRGPRLSVAATDEPDSGPQPPAPDPSGGVRPVSASPPDAGSPWLTRTDDSLVWPASVPGPATTGSSPRPTAKRDPSGRSERISRPEDRPWIVLPIESDEPPERPAG